MARRGTDAPRAEGVPAYEYRDGGATGDALMAAVVDGLDAHVTRDGRLITINDRTVKGAKLRDTSPAVTALAGLGKARLDTGGLALPPKVTKSGRATTFGTGEAARPRATTVLSSSTL